MTKHSGRLILGQIASLLFFLVFLSACSGRNGLLFNSGGTIDSFSTIEIDTTTALFASYEKPDCHLHLCFEIPEKVSSEKTLRAAEAMIVSLADGEAEGESAGLGDILRQYTKSYIMNYLEEGIDAIANYGNDIEANANWMTYEEVRDGKVLYNNNGIFSYSVKTYTYTGGAHGNSSNNVASLSLTDNTIFSFDKLFSSEKSEELKQLVVKKLNTEYQLLTDEVVLTDNFFIDGRGVTFVYDPMDIAAYSDGEIEVTIHWEEAKAFLKSPEMFKL